jgi:hypothetical protein
MPKTTEELKEIIRQHLLTKWPQYYKDVASISDAMLVEHLLYEDEPVHTESAGSSRWWDNELRVLKYGDTYISCLGASTTGDRSPNEVGWEFDWNSVEEVRPVEKTITVYEPVESN